MNRSKKSKAKAGKNVAQKSDPPEQSGPPSQSSTQQQLDSSAPAAPSSKPAPRTSKTSEMLEPIPTNVIENNLDNILEDVRQLDNTCDFSRCRTKTTYIGQDCALCKQRYCMKHQLPEVHGCGGAIKKVERTEFLKKPNQSLPISAALRRNEHKGAQARLEQKLKDMSLARKKNHK